jgi:hypothetical protein
MERQECMRASGARCRAAALPPPRNGTIPLPREVITHTHTHNLKQPFMPPNGNAFFFSPTPSLGPLRQTHTHNQGGRRKELARSCRCGGDDPTRVLPLGRRAVTQPSQLEAPPARGLCRGYHPVPPGAPCLLFLCPSSIESLVLVSAPPVCRAVALARLAGRTSCAQRECARAR